jgi:hypothetical protein
VLDARPKNVLEIGMAHGISTLAILTALRDLTAGCLTSIDPAEVDDWQGAGLELVRMAGLTQWHRHIAEPDYFALPSLLRQGYECDFAYIDGMHSFEYTFLDVFYIDRLIARDGIIGFNDCGMPAVGKVIRYISSHLHYLEIRPQRVGWLERRRLRFWEFPDQYFRKIETRSVPWDFYREF